MMLRHGLVLKYDQYVALKETLESRGVLNQLKARIRAEIFNAIDDQVLKYYTPEILNGIDTWAYLS